MAIIRRPQPQPVQAQETVPKPAVKKLTVQEVLERSKGRPLTTTTVNNAAARAQKVEAAKAIINENLKLISEAERQIDDAQSRIERAHGVIEHQLRENNIQNHTDGVYLAELAEQWTRQMRNIDPKKFKNHVANEVFWNSIVVSIQHAQQHMSDKEINDISDVIPAKCNGIVLKVKKLEPKRRAKK